VPSGRISRKGDEEEEEEEEDEDEEEEDDEDEEEGEEGEVCRLLLSAKDLGAISTKSKWRPPTSPPLYRHFTSDSSRSCVAKKRGEGAE